MPTLRELIEDDDVQPIGSLDDADYFRVDIIVEIRKDGNVRPLCMADLWDHMTVAQLIEAHKEIFDLQTMIDERNKAIASFDERLQKAIERSVRATWLESEVMRLTEELETFRREQAEARSRLGVAHVDTVLSNTDAIKRAMGQAWHGIPIIEDQTMPDDTIKMATLADPAVQTTAPIFKKLCQCDACLELRAYSGYPIAEIEGH